MAKLPRWGDDEAMLAWIGPLIPEPKPIFDVLFPEEVVVQPGIPLVAGRSPRETEQEAFQTAKQGDFRMLAWMREHKMPLSKESEQLINARLRGEFKAERSGPAKQLAARRRARSKVYGAADEVAIIQAILKQHFPNEHGHREQAITLAASRANISRGTLANHFKSRRRPTLFEE